MSWLEVSAALRELTQVRNDGGSMASSWRSFVDLVNADPGRHPFHLRAIVGIVEDVGRAQGPNRVRILDHGGGGCSTLLYLCAMGYNGIHGIDLHSSNAKRWNRLLSEVLDIQETRLFSYDGRHLLFADDSFDVVFSQQVLEHVRPDVVDTYYAEEYRVLKPGGVVFHQVPHRLVPYDSHTRTWFLHLLPYRAWRWVLRRLGKSSETTETALFLRWPWIHRRKIGEHFHHNVDVTIDRLVGIDDYSTYDGPVRLRQAITRVVGMPLMGPLARRALKNLVMIDTVSRKRG
ncbi:MAG: class I SAM-dependent methyltransferase [Alphaproteobacteria bacterium]